MKCTHPDLYCSLTVNILAILALTLPVVGMPVFQPATMPSRVPDAVIILADNLGFDYHFGFFNFGRGDSSDYRAVLRETELFLTEQAYLKK